jgi:15-cis-phytoene desaturase
VGGRVGLHRVLGFYDAFPGVLRKAGIDVNQIVCWEDEIEIRLADGGGSGVYGAAPLYRPYETVRGTLGNLDLLPLADRIPFTAFMTGGLLQYYSNPSGLDQWSVTDFARTFGVPRRTINNILVPLTSGLYFLPPERYSAYVFFGTLGPYLQRILTLRVGAFLGGITEVMAAPMAAAIVRNGSVVRTVAPATRLMIESGCVTGVEAGRAVAVETAFQKSSLV